MPSEGGGDGGLCGHPAPAAIINTDIAAITVATTALACPVRL
jgi:hypothetical protein